MDIDSEILPQLKLNEENESGEKYIPEYLYLFRKAIEDMDGNLLCPTDDIFLLKFLRTKKFNVEESTRLLHLYFLSKIQNKEMVNICFTTLKPIYEQRLHTVLRHRDCEGRKILYFRLTAWNPAEIKFEEVMVAAFFLLEEMTQSEDTQKKGVVIIIDGAQISFHQARMIGGQFTFGKIKKLIPYLQGTFPALFKGLHFVNWPFVLSLVCHTVKFFLKPKLKERTHLHGSNIKSLHNFIGVDILPQELGGSHSIDEIEDKELMQSMFGRADYFKSLKDTYGYQNAT